MSEANYGVKGRAPCGGIGGSVPKVLAINGPILRVTGEHFEMAEMVEVNGLPGEVIAVTPHEATVQLYESTSGLSPGTAVHGTGRPMSLKLQPGLIGGIFDGIMRPLMSANSTENGHINPPPQKFTVQILAKPGQELQPGDIFAEARESAAITYKAMLPPEHSGVVTHAMPDGEYTADDKILTLETPAGKQDFTLSQTWPIRIPRPVRQKLPCDKPLSTGIRIIDSLFPIAKGGTCAIPGGFGTGKTSTQHQIAKFCNADIIVYACVIIEPTRRSQQNQGFREVGHYVTYHTAGAVSATEKN